MPARHARSKATLGYAEPSRVLPLALLASLAAVLVLGVLSALLSLAHLA
jgi:hypothetical protein